ncbi:transposase domain-containing protein [Streptomyces sp. NPDC001156]
MPAIGRSAFAAGHLGELTQIITPQLVDEVLVATRRVQRRVRKLPSRVVMYFVLAMTIFPGCGYAGVWAR